MFILLISRGIPTKEDPQWGCFEKDQAEALAAYGHKVVVMSVDARFKRHRGKLGMHHIENNSVNYYNYVMLPGILLSKIAGKDYYTKKIKYHFYEKIFLFIEKKYGKPDIIYSHFFFNTLYGVLLKDKYGIPIVGIEHQGRFNEPVLPKKTENVASCVFPKVNGLIAVSEKLSKNIEKRFHIPCTVVNNMYGNEFLDIPNSVFTRKENKQLIFISVARIDYKKGFDVLIKAFQKANLSKGSWKLNIIGWGEDKKKLEKLIKDNNLQDNVFLLGKQNKNDIVSELRNSDIFVLASRLETFGIVFIEAMSQGLPVIGTICGGPEEIINEKNGLLVPSEDVNALSEAIKTMVDNYSLYDRKFIAEDCKKKYSPMAIAEKLTFIFDDVLRKKSSEEQKG